MVCLEIENLFKKHADTAEALLKTRVRAVQIDSVAHDSKRQRADTGYGVRSSMDAYAGDVALRDMRAILAIFDSKGCVLTALRSGHERE